VLKNVVGYEKGLFMTREEAKKILTTLGIEEPSEEQVTKYLDALQGETKSERDKSKALKEKADKADELQKLLDEKDESTLSEIQKSQKQNELLQEQIKTLTSQSYSSSAKSILSQSGLTEEDMEAILPGMIADSLENTQARANAYVSAINKIKESTIKAKDEEFLKKTGKPGGGSGSEPEKTLDIKFAEQLSQTKASQDKAAIEGLSNFKS
jgi:hypothetical protein